MRILIGTPVKEHLPVRFAKSIDDIIRLNKDIDIETQYEYGALYDARDRICARTLKDNFDYVLFCDSDMTFPSDVITKLTSHNADAITGVYVDKHENHKPLLFTELMPEDDDMPPRASRKSLDLSKPLITVKGCGAGCLLLSNHALRLLKIREHDWFKPFKGLGEDVSLCYRLSRLNIPIYCDTTVHCGHIKEIEYTVEDWTGVCDDK